MYRFILQRETSSGLEELEFPLAPEKMTTNVGNKNKTIDLVKMGEVNIQKDIGLRTFSFKVLLPKDETLITGTKLFVDSNGETKDMRKWVKMKFHEPIWYLSRIREIKALKEKVFFVIIRELVESYNDDGTAKIKQLFGGNLTVTIEDYKVEENAGEEGDYWVELKLKEYRKIDVQKHIEKTGSVDEDGKEEAVEVKDREDTKAVPKTYTVQEDDTLWSIAKKYLGDGSRWSELYELNKDIIDDPDLIYPGWVLKISEINELHEPTINEGSFTVTTDGELIYKEAINVSQSDR